MSAAPQPAHRHVLVLEDSTLLRTQLIHSLTLAGYGVTAHDSVDAMASAQFPGGPCVALLDMRLADGSGLDALRVLHRRQPGLPVVFISSDGQPQEIAQALSHGAIEFLLKPFSLATLLAALERGMAQEDARLARQAQQAFARGLFTRLSPREREVSQMVADGIDSAGIATRLGVGQEAVRVHRQRVFEKLEVQSPAGVAQRLHQAGLRELPPHEDDASAAIAGEVDLAIDIPGEPDAQSQPPSA